VGANKGACQVRLDDIVPFGKRVGLRLLADGDAGIVDKDVNTAKPFHGGFDH
jgi:hypothetical protein